MYLIPNESFHTKHYNTFRIVICVDHYYYYSCGILLLTQAHPKMPCIYTSYSALLLITHNTCIYQVSGPYKKPWCSYALVLFPGFPHFNLPFLFRLVGASPRWLVLRLAIAVVNQFNCPNAERLRIHIKILHISA